jgi:hypothetical protein
VKKIYIYLFLLFLTSFLVSLPFFKSGFFETHDGGWAVVRLGAMHRAVTDFHIPARWASELNFGYGYPLFEFTYPLPYYLGEVINLSGFGLVDSIKILFIFSVFASGIGMFFLSRKVFGDLGAFISSGFYLFANYRLVNLYVRGSIGESLSLVLFPILFLLVLLNVKKPSFVKTSLFALTFAALLLTHNVTALVFSPFLLIFYLFLIYPKKERKSIIHMILGFALGGLLSSFFLLPALLEKKYISLSISALTNIKDHFLSPQLLVSTPWNYGSFASADRFSPEIGIFPIIALVLASLVFYRHKDIFVRKIFMFSSVSILILVFLMLPYSFLFYQLPLFSNIDFPWRLLTPLIFFLSLSLGILGQKKIWAIAGLLLLIFTAILNFPHARPNSYVSFPDDYYLTNQSTTTSSDELMPIWVKEKPEQKYERKVEVISGDADINIISQETAKTVFEINAEEESRIALNTIYYPGWELNENGRRVEFSYDNPEGIIEFDINEGTHELTAEFKDNSLRTFANFLSILGIIVVLILWVKRFVK